MTIRISSPEDLLAALPGPVPALMLAGGALYSVGVGFYRWERLRFHYTIWHICVLAATAAFYTAILLLTLQGADNKFQLLNL